MRSKIKKQRRRRKRQWGRYSLLAIVILAIPILSWVFRNTSLCEVRRITIQGVRYGMPEEMLQTAGITTGMNLFSDLSALEKSLSTHPLVRDVSFERRPPRSLFIRIEEREPFVFLSRQEPVPLSRDGRILPEDRIARDLDLPLLTIEGSEGDFQSGQTAGIRFLSHLEESVPSLLARVSELIVKDGRPALLFIGNPRTRVVLGEQFSRIHSNLLTSALTNLENAHGFYEIDLRFKNQAVVRQIGGKSIESLHGAI